MSKPTFEVRLLQKNDWTGFDCGVEALNTYLRKQARSEMKRRVATCFVAMHQETKKAAGFYTLSASQIPLTDLDEEWSRRLPRYKTVPAVLIGRLAVDKSFRKQGLGSGLILDAVSRVVSSEIASNILAVDAKDENAMLFYRHLGFRQIPDGSNKMIIPVTVIAKALGL